METTKKAAKYAYRIAHIVEMDQDTGKGDSVHTYGVYADLSLQACAIADILLSSKTAKREYRDMGRVEWCQTHAVHKSVYSDLGRVLELKGYRPKASPYTSRINDIVCTAPRLEGMDSDTREFTRARNAKRIAAVIKSSKPAKFRFKLRSESGHPHPAEFEHFCRDMDIFISVCTPAELRTACTTSHVFTRCS